MQWDTKVWRSVKKVREKYVSRGMGEVRVKNATSTSLQRQQWECSMGSVQEQDGNSMGTIWEENGQIMGSVWENYRKKYVTRMGAVQEGCEKGMRKV